MNNKKLAFLISGLIAAFGLFTPWDSYRKSNLPTVATINAEQTFLRADTLHVVAKAYTAEESQKYLRKDLLRRGYQPVQITIQNNSAEEFSLSSGSVDLPTVTPNKIANKLVHSAIPRSIILRVASLFFWPFAIPSTIDSMITLKSYKTIKNDLESKLVKKEVIAPYSIYNRIVFVPISAFKGSFDVTLIELHSLKAKVVHISGLEMGKTIETTSDVEHIEPAMQAPLETSAQNTGTEFVTS